MSIFHGHPVSSPYLFVSFSETGKLKGGPKFPHIQDLVNGAEKEILAVCKEENIELAVLRSGSRRRPIARARSRLALKLVNELGLSLAETARQLGLSTSAIAQILRRNH